MAKPVGQVMELPEAEVLVEPPPPPPWKGEVICPWPEGGRGKLLRRLGAARKVDARLAPALVHPDTVGEMLLELPCFPRSWSLNCSTFSQLACASMSRLTGGKTLLETNLIHPEPCYYL
jgi:hypothetical protein